MCGDGLCEGALGEDLQSCFDDCHCGDGVCAAEAGEDHDSCPADCALCGDGLCQGALGEDLQSCFDDCHCGDGTCAAELGEDHDACPADCARCGDGLCQVELGEGAASCAVDCMPLRAGVLTNLTADQIAGWEPCWSSLYNVDNIPMATVLANCTGDLLMMACRPVGAETLTVAAQGHRQDVLFDVGDLAVATHEANGVSWYFSQNKSWGFVPAGASVNRNSCDTNGPNEPTRLCWHMSGNQMNGGYRCGATASLNDSITWERLLYQRLAAPVCGDRLCDPEESAEGCPVDCADAWTWARWPSRRHWGW